MLKYAPSNHAEYYVADFPETDIKSSVEFSDSSESVYVRYSSKKTGKSVTCRFSWHQSNAERFGDVLNGYWAGMDDILFRLGYKNRKFIPDTQLVIISRKVAKKQLALYEEAPLTIREMYALGEGADLTQYVGKIAKGGNYLILGDKVEKSVIKVRDSLGIERVRGSFIYENKVLEDE